MRLTLITNLAGVNVGDVRINAHALLLEDSGDDRMRFRLRGFDTEAVSELFAMPVPSVDRVFELDATPGIVGAFPGAKVVTRHGWLRIVEHACAYANDPRVDHQDDPYTPCACVVLHLDSCSTDERAIDFEDFEGDWPDAQFRERVWNRLHAKVVHFWEAPFVGVRSSVRLELARKATAGDLR